MIPRIRCTRLLAGQPLQPWRIQHRQISLKAVVLPPVLFTGLLVSLWVQKCIVLVVFQNRIIYMPGMPPNSALETIDDYKRQCRSVDWKETKIRARDGTHLFLCLASVDGSPYSRSGSVNTLAKRPRPVYILYFQGNAGSTPPRLPDLSAILKLLEKSNSDARFTLVCLAYRGYWKSSGRPSEAGLNTDAEAAYSWILEHHAQSDLCDQPPLLVLWGHSIGAGIASNLAATVYRAANQHTQTPPQLLLLETPFVSTREMLGVLYPQKWLPYKHLWPFLRNHLDTAKNLHTIAACPGARSQLRVAIVQAARDELVPQGQGAQLEAQCRELGIVVVRASVGGAFHNEASSKPQGQAAIVAAIREVVDSGVVGLIRSGKS